MTAEFEIVRVIDEHTVVDAESYQLSPDGAGARDPGFYVMSHEDETSGRRRRSDVWVAGPFKNFDQALAAAYEQGFSRYR